MSKGVEIDFETRSAVELKTHGVYRYMADPSTTALMASYQIDGGPVQRWRYGQPCPADLREAIERGDTISAHNAAFERLLMQRVLAPRHGWPMPKTSQFRCTAATAAAMALPRKLEHLGEALDLPVQKDKAGAALIRKFSKPRAARKGETAIGILFNEPQDFQPDFERFHDYCDDDVRTEAEADKRMVPLSTFEQQVYTMSEIINDRGVRIDLKSAHAALRLAEKAKKALDREMRLATGGFVTACSQVAKLTEWVQAQGVPMSSAAKAELESLLELNDLPSHVRKAIEIRQEGSKSSVSKIKAMIDRAGDDGRVRGAFVYHSASTGRWQSVGVNFANMPRPRRCYDDAHLNTQILFEAIRSEDPDYLQMMYGAELGRPLHLLSDAIRGFIWAGPGRKLVQADYSGIEGAVIAWSSGEDWKVAEMHKIIADPSIPDLYRQTAADIMNTTTDVVTKKHPFRQSVGKVSELALGFGGGVMAFVSMAKNYGVDLNMLFAPVWETADEERREKAARRYEGVLKRGKEGTDILTREAWLACELIKVGWRAKNAAIAKGWSLREEAIREAIRNPGQKVHVLNLTYLVTNGFLWCRLPSGRCLAYASPKLKDQVWAKVKLPDGEWSDSEVMDRELAEKLALKGEVQIQGPTSPAISVLGVGKNGRMQREHLYGGLVAENDTQAIARDLLVNGMIKAEAAGYEIVAHVYDEMIAEVPIGFGDLREFEKLICELPDWAAGMPLTAGGFEAKRYRKD
ncbi:DNA polymerase [Ochrobactrum sp. A-1]|uniref:DNA polymerase n=1 Tax=Ochrobactrum sp. A-1 TaxID=2920940 RepID=UPI001F0A3B3E|nr:DNA polymerase [Ochrobactrum sp. A-1]